MGKNFRMLLVNVILTFTVIQLTGCSSYSDVVVEMSETHISSEKEKENDIELEEEEETETELKEEYSDYVVISDTANLYIDNDVYSTITSHVYKNSILKISDFDYGELKKVKEDDNNFLYIKSECVEEFTGDYTVYDGYQVVDEITKYGMIVVSSANVRTNPDVTSDVVTILNNGDSFEIFATTKNDWNVIKYNDAFCYISSDVLNIIDKQAYESYLIPASKVDIAQYNVSLIGTYTTNYAPVATNRGKNVEKASYEIDSYYIPAGSVFNWCRDMGACGQNEGYLSSTEISNGKYVIGYGGGICQISSTLCATVLTASEGDFEFLARKSHSKAQKYIPHELDATVSYPTTNLIIRNNNDYGIIIKSYYSGGNVTVEIYKIN